MKVFEHRSAYNANKPVLIFERKYASGGNKIIRGAIKDGDSILNVGDAIISNYIGTSGFESLPYKVWEVIEIKERSTPKGHFIIDIDNAGFIAVVKPASDNVISEIIDMGIRI